MMRCSCFEFLVPRSCSFCIRTQRNIPSLLLAIVIARSPCISFGFPPSFSSTTYRENRSRSSRTSSLDTVNSFIE
ncbi:hypothetical protein BDV59DRAFT_177125 [Aspergillus ambiguus]|uniref:uncharacterized protein n=1 Tax=Aspergillus ambiguus TaxID=176160 RepID=UPI003CCDAEA9